jgi:capsular polysaccharide biosynthesis protein
LKFESEKLKNVPKTFSLTFEKPLPGEEFLNSYIIYVAQQAETILLKQLTQVITNEIKLTKQNLEITNSTNPNILILSTKPESFGKDNHILHQKRLANLNDQLDEIKKVKLDYNIILDKASPAIEISKSVQILLVIAFLMGLFLSFIIIFIKSTLIQ